MAINEPAKIALRRSAAGSDQALLRGLTSGGAKGFAAFYERFAPTLFSLACHILREEKAAEEALQESFVQMSRHSSAFDPAQGSLFSWAVMITRSRALARLRQTRHPRSNSATPDVARSVRDAKLRVRLLCSAHDDRERVTAALAKLSERQREALELAFFGAMTPEEISSRLDVAVDLVKAHLRRGLLSLRDGAAHPTPSADRARQSFHSTAAAPDYRTEETKNMTSSPQTNEGSNAESFDSFVQKNFPPVYRFAFCMSLAPAAAAHLTNAAFAQARRAQREGTHPAVNKQWLLSTVHHEWLGGRASRSAAAHSESSRLTEPLLEAQHVAHFDQAVVLEALHGMKEELRLVLSLFYFEKLAYGEIAVILEIPAATVLAHLAEAKTVLRQHLESTRIGDPSQPRPRASETIESPGG